MGLVRLAMPTSIVRPFCLYGGLINKNKWNMTPFTKLAKSKLIKDRYLKFDIDDIKLKHDTTCKEKFNFAFYNLYHARVNRGSSPG